jgi:hypothetical protein
VVKTLGSESSTAGTLPGVTFNRNLLEGMLRELLLQRGDRCVELYEGTGASWRIARWAKALRVLLVLLAGLAAWLQALEAPAGTWGPAASRAL